ncbi:thiol-disulfide oxidoreductase DCC family protein [Ensifer adhaerens]|uniref:thiol-disulfide oxidoreductase DCC family protein n=1 Tax=Ensifer adhaerens TaxID=106592 RepID=UPI001CC11B49|nr:thiol-disulfide oxidoreductase DCC family protein [Ensifer adhaerens]MBZ7920776.1 thiol-disulfide oxidoreductase DCC family protein [Ensifer adhaerens]UAX93234.1 thiol-disulfide oxidoreductase DCC family protein [Ensifer adhaerens]UAY00871.1 thiol-disulfide oxidoreductase DCC family protein [Ensifer adhaerens]UAY08252.1 thiol-disulfide oxidoreductase DCC family protein [Ensifer adhaerens]
MRRGAYSYRNDASVHAFADDKPVVVFDGECIFCSGWVRFLLRHDRRAQYRYLTAQSPIGQALYRHYGLDAVSFESNMLIEDDVARFKSDGSIRTLARLGLPWSLVNLCRILPAILRDPLYDLVARNRYRIAGRRQTCMVPTPDERGRFIA